MNAGPEKDRTAQGWTAPNGPARKNLLGRAGSVSGPSTSVAKSFSLSRLSAAAERSTVTRSAGFMPPGQGVANSTGRSLYPYLTGVDGRGGGSRPENRALRPMNADSDSPSKGHSADGESAEYEQTVRSLLLRRLERVSDEELQQAFLDAKRDLRDGEEFELVLRRVEQSLTQALLEIEGAREALPEDEEDGGE